MHPQETGIVPFRDEFAAAFDQLNRAWLESHDLLGIGDLPYLEDPRGNVIERGGAILCAVRGDSVIGTAAILRVAQDTFELAKFAVAPIAQGQGLGRRLAHSAIGLAASLGARRIVLSSSSRLTAALGLYQSLGFRQSAPAEGSVAYGTADIHMTLELQDPTAISGSSPHPSLQRTSLGHLLG